MDGSPNIRDGMEETTKTKAFNWARLCAVVLAVPTVGLLLLHVSNSSSPEGAGYAFGLCVVAFAIAFVVIRGDRRKQWRVPVALGIALLTLVTARARDVVGSSDDRNAARIIANARSRDDVDRAIRENPDNTLLRLVGATMAVKDESGRRLQELLEGSDDKELDQDFRQADLPSLQRYMAALRAVESNMPKVRDGVARIFDDQLDAVKAAADRIVPDVRTRDSFMKGFEKGRGREIEAWGRYIAAHDAVLTAHGKQVAFLIEINGRYAWDAKQGSIRFRQSDDLEKYNEHANAVASADAKMQAARAELEALTQWPPKSASR